MYLVFSIILIQFHRAIRENTVQTVIIVNPIEIKSYLITYLLSLMGLQCYRFHNIFMRFYFQKLFLTQLVIICMYISGKQN